MKIRYFIYNNKLVTIFLAIFIVSIAGILLLSTIVPSDQEEISPSTLGVTSCNPVSEDLAIQNVKKLPEVQNWLDGTPYVKDDIEIGVGFEDANMVAWDGGDKDDPHYHIRVFHTERSLTDQPKGGGYFMHTYNEYIVDKCTGKLITSRWLYDQNGNVVSHEENPDFLIKDSSGNYSNDNYKKTIFW